MIWTKDAARSTARTARRALTDRDRRSGRVIATLDERLRSIAAPTQLWYLGLAEEVQTTDAVLRRLKDDEIRVVVPYCVGETLGLFELHDPRELTAGAFGVREPAESLRRNADRQSDPSSIDVAIVPGLAFDRRGNRVGFGRGYYDRLLSRLRPGALKIGLAFDCQIFDEIQADRHDVAVDTVVTETESLGDFRYG